MDKNIGKRLDGRYEITELIGIGGMADVYKAMDIVDKKVVAVKILKNEFADNDDFVRRFRNESKAIAVLSHPNIVKIFDVGFTEKMQFIVMEYIDGITLKEFMEQQEVLKWKDAVFFIIQVLRALQHAHDRGIVHRDIKPQNIMLFPNGTIKVMDFGIARFAREEGKTLSDKAIGSVHYISPEQAKGDVTDEKSDIYSTGIMLYEMLTGRKPFDGDSPVAIALMHMQNQARPPRAINDAIPEGLEEIVMRAMQKEAARRYQSASEMIHDIEEFKNDPSVRFGYKLSTAEAPKSAGKPSADAEKTQYFDRNEVSGGAAAMAVSRYRNAADAFPEKKTSVRTRPAYDDYDDDDDDDDESVSKTSYFIVTLTAITAAIVIVVVALIALNIEDIIVPKEQTIDKMPNLIGVNYLDAKSTYAPYFNLTVDSQEYSAEYAEGVIIKQTPKEGKDFIVKNTDVKVVVSRGPQMVTVQNVYDLEANTAQSMLSAQDFNVSIMFQISDVEKNHVIKTEPERNTAVEKGSTIIMYVSQGPEIQDVIMEKVVGMKASEASSLLKGKGLKVKVETVDSLEEKDKVIAQSIPATDDYGDPMIVSGGTEIVLQVSSGIPPATEENITFAVPSDLEGSAMFRAYINGNVAGEQNVDNITYVSTVTITVEGAKTQTVNIEVENTETGEKEKLGEYVVDFTEGTVTEMSMDKKVFEELFGVEEETTTEEEDFDNEGAVEIDDDPVPEEDEPIVPTVPEDDIIPDEFAPEDEIVDSSEDEGWWQTIIG